MKFSDLKFRNQLFLILVLAFIPLIMIAGGMGCWKVHAHLESQIENQLMDSTNSVLTLVEKAVSVSIKEHLSAIALDRFQMIEIIYTAYEEGQISKSEAMDRIKTNLSELQKGQAGCVYVLDVNGNVIFPPVFGESGKTASLPEPLVRQQIRVKQGYLEFKPETGKKNFHDPVAVSMVYFQPLGWIVTAAAQRDDASHLADINDFKDVVLSFRTGKSGYAFILDQTGHILVHPDFEKGEAFQLTENQEKLFNSTLWKTSGQVNYQWKKPGGDQARDKVVFFKRVPQIEWIVATSSYVDELYAPLRLVLMFLITGCAAILIAMGFIAFWVSRFITRPLETMVDELEGIMPLDPDSRLTEPGPAEFRLLARHLNQFLQRLHEKNLQIEAETLQKTASQAALVENELKLRNLFDQSFQLIGILSPFGIIEEVNQSLLEFSGDSQEETLFRPYWEACWWRHDAEIRNAVQAAVEKAVSGESSRFETTAINASEQIRSLDFSIKPVKVPSGEVAFIIAEARDNTEFKAAAVERKNLAVHLERSQKMEAIGTLAGGIAHDFNNILSGMMGYTQLLEMNLNDTVKAKAHIQQIGKGTLRAADLINQILTFSRRSEFEKQPLKLQLILKEALKLIRSSIPATIEIREKITGADKILADPTRMHQVVMNLCTNAYHAMNHTGGVMTVCLDTVIHKQADQDFFERRIPPGKYLQMSVKDTGHGMDRNVLSKAFDPYFTTKEMGKGTGFGLALVHAIVDEHDGYICVQTEPGKGTEFRIFLPVADDLGQNADDAGSLAPARGGHETIMVVDDESDLREILELFLSDLGYRIYVYENGESAFEAFCSDPDKFECIITDMAMPKMTGAQLIQNVFAMRSDIPAILCTGFSETLSEEDSRKMGVAAYVRKPVDNHELAVLIRRILDEKAGNTPEN